MTDWCKDRLIKFLVDEMIVQLNDRLMNWQIDKMRLMKWVFN
jgi:hypothetical protein